MKKTTENRINEILGSICRAEHLRVGGKLESIKIKDNSIFGLDIYGEIPTDQIRVDFWIPGLEYNYGTYWFRLTWPDDYSEVYEGTYEIC